MLDYRSQPWREVDLHVRATAGEVVTFFLFFYFFWRAVPCWPPVHEIWRLLPGKVALLNFFQKSVARSTE